MILWGCSLSDDDVPDDEDRRPWAPLTDSGSTTSDDSGSELVPADEVEVDVFWTNYAIEVTVKPADSYWFGVVESIESCEPYCWTGEDCAYGYQVSEIVYGPYCHPLSEGRAELMYGADIDSVQEEVETVFPSDEWDGLTTYFLQSATEGTCWVWGLDPGYYDGFGCTVL